MVYLVVAIGQFGVILLMAILKEAGLILGSTALVMCLITALIVAAHAVFVHLQTRTMR